MIAQLRAVLGLGLLVGIPAGCAAAVLFAFAAHLHRIGVLP